MSKIEKTELISIPVIVFLTWLTTPLLPEEVRFGTLLIICSGIFFLQSFLRDILRLCTSRTRSRQDDTRAACICLDSVAGLVVLGVGTVLLQQGKGQSVELAGSCWSLMLMVVLVTGFLVKDLVVEIRPFRIRRVKDHNGVIVSWRKH